MRLSARFVRLRWQGNLTWNRSGVPFEVENRILLVTLGDKGGGRATREDRQSISLQRHALEQARQYNTAVSE